MLSEIIARDVALFYFVLKGACGKRPQKLRMLEKFVLRPYQLRIWGWFDKVSFSLDPFRELRLKSLNEGVCGAMGKKKG